MLLHAKTTHTKNESYTLWWVPALLSQNTTYYIYSYVNIPEKDNDIIIVYTPPWKYHKQA